MIEFNINESVRVKLTETGIAELKRQHAEFHERHPLFEREFAPPKTDAEGWSEWQLWDLMNRLGPLLSMGRNPPFETTIRLDIKSEEIKP